MITKRIYLVLFLAIISACDKTTSKNDNKLFSSNARAQGSKNVDVIVSEIERKEKTSIVDVKFNYGPSVASSVFIVCSFTKLAKIRGYRYTVQVRNFKKEVRYLLGFISSNSKEEISSLGTEFVTNGNYEVLDSEKFNSIC